MPASGDSDIILLQIIMEELSKGEKLLLSEDRPQQRDMTELQEMRRNLDWGDKEPPLPEIFSLGGNKKRMVWMTQ